MVKKHYDTEARFVVGAFVALASVFIGAALVRSLERSESDKTPVRPDNWVDTIDQKIAFRFPSWLPLLLAIICIAIARYLFDIKDTEEFVAISGALLECFGLLNVARPIARLGGYKKLLASIRKPLPLSKGEIVQQDIDGYSINIFGPALIIVGTMIHGASGPIGRLLERWL